jgi:hypothetical protein
MKEFTPINYYHSLVEYSIATEEEIDLVTAINGMNIETLNDILNVRTGYSDWDQYCDSNMIQNEYKNYFYDEEENEY